MQITRHQCRQCLVATARPNLCTTCQRRADRREILLDAVDGLVLAGVVAVLAVLALVAL